MILFKFVRNVHCIFYEMRSDINNFYKKFVLDISNDIEPTFKFKVDIDVC